MITQGKTIKLVAEVVSSNWQNDYARKLEDYALLAGEWEVLCQTFSQNA